MSFAVDDLVTPDNIHKAVCRVKYNNVIMDNGYSIYLAGSEATVSLTILSVLATDNRCVIQAYSASPNGSWSFLGSMNVDPGSWGGERNVGIAFNSNKDPSIGEKAFPEELTINFTNSAFNYIANHTAGTFTISIDGVDYPVTVSENDDLLTAISNCPFVSNGETLWVCQKYALGGNSVRLCRVNNQLANATGLSIDWNTVIPNPYSGDVDFVSLGRKVDDGTLYFSDYDCTRWKVVVSVPYGDLRVWGLVRANAYNTLCSLNTPNYVESKYKDQYIYKWDKNLGRCLFSTSDLKQPNDIAKRLTDDKTPINVNNYSSFTIRGRY